MSTFQAGDIITIANKKGIWIVVAFTLDVPSNQFMLCYSVSSGDDPRKRLHSTTCGVGDMTLIVRPDYTIGQIVRYQGYQGTVSDFSPDDTVIYVNFSSQVRLHPLGTLWSPYYYQRKRHNHKKVDWHAAVKIEDLTMENYALFTSTPPMLARLMRNMQKDQ